MERLSAGGRAQQRADHGVGRVADGRVGGKFSEATLDGVNLIPFLAGADTALPHDKLFWRSDTTQYALRAGDWKLLFFQNTTRLYNLATDQGESTNLAAANPAKLNELKALYDQWNAQLPPAP